MGREGLDSRGCPENDDERKHTAQRMMAWIPEQGSRMTEGERMGREGLDSRGCPENDGEKKRTAQRMMAWIPEQGSRMTATERHRGNDPHPPRRHSRQQAGIQVGVSY